MRSTIGARDVFTGVAIVLSVAALAQQGTPDWGPQNAEARPALPTQQHDNERDRRPEKSRSFNRLTANEFKASDATFETIKVDKINVSEFTVSDADGIARATINVDGGNVLRFRAGSEKTNESFILSVFPDGRAAFLLKDDRGRNRIAIAIAEDGRPFVNLTDNPSITLDDSHSRNRLVMRLDEHGKPTIRLDDHKVSTRTISDSIPVDPKVR